MTTRPKSSFTQAREQFAGSMVAACRQIEAWLARAEIPGTPEHAELSVRKGKRNVDMLAKVALRLRNAHAPEPWITAPTPERAAKSVIDPEADEVGKTIVGVRHRVTWPVEQMRRRALLEVPQIMAGARFRRAYEDSRPSPGTSNYTGVFGASDPRGKLPIPKGEIARQRRWNGPGHSPLAGEEFTFCWERLEPDLRATAWVLVLEEPLPNEAHALSPAEFGRRITNMRSEEFARAFVLGMLRVTLVRLDTIYGHWNKAQRERRERIAGQ